MEKNHFLLLIYRLFLCQGVSFWRRRIAFVIPEKPLDPVQYIFAPGLALNLTDDIAFSIEEDG